VWSVRYELVADKNMPDFLDLPWAIPLAEWDSTRLVDVVRGISRHVVRFVHYDGAIFALKEINPRLARKEYRLLRDLAEHAVPVVEAVGVVSDRPDGLDAILVTRHLDFSLPYRTLFSGHGVPNLRERLLDALAELLVRLHVAGFFWGDCSLSNALFRRDAGALSAYLVDAETGEMHPTLCDATGASSRGLGACAN
jgi:Lipopolysaccharide kinase (Kdo/WaaP) family